MTIDQDGRVWAQKRGGKSSVFWYRFEVPENGVLTHIHPITENVARGSDFYRSIGSPFSMQDLRFAADHNLAEIRAVTPNYTFSFRRPAGGWPDYSSFEKNANAIIRRRKKEGRNYYEESWEGRYGDQRLGRINITIYHRAAQDLAKLTGATYTRSRNK